MSTQAPATSSLRPGDARWWFGQLAIIRATAAETAGAYSVVEINVPPGYGTPLHVHHAEDEGFLMLEGRARFQVGDDVAEGGPGDFLFGPRDIPHRWEVVGDEPVRLLYLFTPGGFEALVEAMSVPARELTFVPPDVVPPEDAPEIAKRFGAEILG
jgi:quercetin dioxygenase-like cupin family protein